MKSAAPKEKRAPRTPKECQFMAEYLSNGGNGTQAALAAYDCSGSRSPERTASVIAAENLGKLSISDALEAAGLGTKELAGNLARIALEATRTDPFTGKQVPDNAVQLQAMRLAAGLMGLDLRGRQEPAATPIPILALVMQGGGYFAESAEVS
jgi:hypothetical protein